MGIQKRIATMLAVAGLLVAGGATVAQAQDTSSSARSDTMGYQPSQGQNDTSAMAPGGAGQAALPDTVVCRDGSNSEGKVGCASHRGIDWAATKAAIKARGGNVDQIDTTAVPADSGQTNKEGAGNYQYNGAPSDTALKAKPGTQTGASPDSGTGAGTSADSGMSADSGAMKSDSSGYR